MTITFNSPPSVVTDTFPRAPGLSLKIPLAALAGNDSDPDGDSFWLTGISAASTNNVTLYTNATYIFYTNILNVDDSFTYTVQDAYGGVATGTGYIVVSTNVFGLITHLAVGGNGSVTASVVGIPGYPYQVQRATNAGFSGTWRVWNTNAPADGLFQILDNFSDLTPPPNGAYYRNRYNP